MGELTRNILVMAAVGAVAIGAFLWWRFRPAKDSDVSPPRGVGRRSPITSPCAPSGGSVVVRDRPALAEKADNLAIEFAL